MKKFLKDVEISGIRKFFNMAKGYDDVISLTLGEPDFSIPKEVEEGIRESLDLNMTHYANNMGILELREEISKYLLNKFSLDFTSEEICITIGGSEAIALSINSQVDEGDYVILPNPGFPAYDNVCKLSGVKILYYGFNEDFSPKFNEIEEALKKNPKAIVLNFPSNPIGVALTKENKEKLYEILKSKDIKIISDEIYAELCYDIEFYSLGQYKDLLDKFILISGFSKMYAMTGLRIGYIAAKGKTIEDITKMHQYSVSCAPSIVQWGAYRGLQKSNIDYMKIEFKNRRDFVIKRLREIGLDVNMPQGAFYAFPSIKKFGMKSDEFSAKLLELQRVACVPGSAFGTNGDDYIRISYSYDMETLKKAMDKIENFIKQI